MNFNFELILFYAVIISGVIALLDTLFLAAKRKKAPPLIIDYARSFFPIFLIVCIYDKAFPPHGIHSHKIENPQHSPDQERHQPEVTPETPRKEKAIQDNSR